MKIRLVIVAAVLLMYAALFSGCTDDGENAVTGAAETTASEATDGETTEQDYEAALSEYFENGYTGEPIELPDIPLD